MSRLLKYFLVLTLLVSISSSQQKLVLNLEQAINIAKKNSPELSIANLDYTKSLKKVSEVYSDNLFPTLTLNSRYIRNFKKQTINIFGQNFELGSDNSINTTIDATESIPFLGVPVFSGIRIAEYYEKISAENVKNTEAKLKADTKKAFLNSLLLKEVITVTQASLSNAEENLRVVEARYKAGVALEFDYIRAKVKVETIKPELNRNRNNLEISNKLLKNTIGLPVNQEIELTGELSYDSLEVWEPMNNLISRVSEKNVAVRQLKLSKLINDELIEVDYANYLPKFYVFAQYGLSTSENDGRGISKYRFFNSLTGGIGLSWNLNFFSTGYKEQQSKIESKKTDKQIRNVKERLKTQTESIFLRIEDAKNRIKAQREIVMQAERGYELANISFLSGVINQIDVIDSQLLLTQAKLGYLQAIYDYLIAKVELEQLLEK